MTRAYARVKILKCSKSLMIKIEYVLGHFKHFKNLRTYAPARALRAYVTRTEAKIPKFCILWIPYAILAIWHNFYLVLIPNKAVRARQRWISARAAMGDIV